MDTVNKPPVKPHEEPFEQQYNYSGNAYGDVKNLQTHGTATIAEVREFLAQTRGKSTQEVLGLIAQSGLVKSTILSAMLIAGLIGFLTVVPFAWNIATGNTKGRPKPKPAETAVDTTSAATASSAESPTTEPTGVATNDDTTGDPALDAMGIGDAKPADPKKNPLEDSLDNLLDKID